MVPKGYRGGAELHSIHFNLDTGCKWIVNLLRSHFSSKEVPFSRKLGGPRAEFVVLKKRKNLLTLTGFEPSLLSTCCISYTTTFAPNARNKV